jgi:hypothetical protein
MQLKLNNKTIRLFATHFLISRFRKIKSKTLSFNSTYIQQQKRELDDGYLVQPKHVGFWIVNKCVA